MKKACLQEVKKRVFDLISGRGRIKARQSGSRDDAFNHSSILLLPNRQGRGPSETHIAIHSKDTFIERIESTDPCRK